MDIWLKANTTKFTPQQVFATLQVQTSLQTIKRTTKKQNKNNNTTVGPHIPSFLASVHIHMVGMILCILSVVPNNKLISVHIHMVGMILCILSVVPNNKLISYDRYDFVYLVCCSKQ